MTLLLGNDHDAAALFAADADILVSTPLRLAALLRSAAPRRLDRVETLVVRRPQKLMDPPPGLPHFPPCLPLWFVAPFCTMHD